MTAVQGVFLANRGGGGLLLDPDVSFARTPEDVVVPPALARQMGLVDGAQVVGEAKRSKQGPTLHTIDSISGVTPDQFRKRPTFARLAAISPFERFDLGATGIPTMRVIDLIAPIGRGTRGLIVAPPKAGKTIILQQIAQAIHANDPNIRIVMLLVDERP
jgi:transcription termination factor Rho